MANLSNTSKDTSLSDGIILSRQGGNNSGKQHSGMERGGKKRGNANTAPKMYTVHVGAVWPATLPRIAVALWVCKW